MAQSSQTDNAHFLSRRDAPVAQRRIGGDAGAQKRGGAGRIECGWEAKDEPFLDHNALRIPSVGHPSEMLIVGIVGKNHVRAELLKPVFAFRAGPVRVHHAPDRNDVAWLVLCHRRSHFRDASDDLMAGNNGIDSGLPLVSYLMEIGVADAAKENFHLHVPFGCLAPRNPGE